MSLTQCQQAMIVGAAYVLGVCRTARDSAKVEDQVQFLARALFMKSLSKWSEPMRYKHNNDDETDSFRVDE